MASPATRGTRRALFVTIPAILLSITFFSGLSEAQIARDNIVVQWNSAALQAVRITRMGPPMVARALAIMHTCTYDAWAAYDATAAGTRLGFGLRRPTPQGTVDNKAKAISYAAYDALVDLFPTQKTDLSNFMLNLGYDPNDKSTDMTTPAGIGNVACQAVLNFRHGDGSNQLGDLHPGAYSDYTGYTAVNDPDKINDANHWQPLRVPDGKGGFTVQPFLGAQWGLVTPFALTSPSQFRTLGKPALYPDPAYVAEVNEILYYSAHLTDRQKMTAEYWADGPKSETPPGHWCLLAQFVARRDNQTIDQSTKMYFALSNALLDVSVAVWDGKRFFDSVRPVTAVHYLYQGKQVTAWTPKGVQQIRGDDWQPYQLATFVTPPFPEYPSGHSAFSAAGAEILRAFTGSNIFGASVTLPAGSSAFEPGVPTNDVTLTWQTFAEAADEAGISRRYGGIHFIDADLYSREIGRTVGRQAWQKAVNKFNGTDQ